MRHLQFIGKLLLIITLNIMLFSPAMLAVNMFSVVVIEKAFAWTVITLSALFVLYQSFRYLFHKEVITDEIGPHVEPIEISASLMNYRQHQIFRNEVELALDQERRLHLKKDMLISLLNERFRSTELTYNRFIQVIHSVEVLFNSNVHGLLNKLRGSELSDLSGIHPRYRAMFTSKVIQQKQQLLNDYKVYVESYLNMNEQILLKLDQLLLEITLLKSIALQEIDQLPCIQDITKLIQQTKYYKG